MWTKCPSFEQLVDDGWGCVVGFWLWRRNVIIIVIHCGGIWTDCDHHCGRIWTDCDHQPSTKTDFLIRCCYCYCHVFKHEFSLDNVSVKDFQVSKYVSCAFDFKATRSAECWNTSESSNPGKAGLHLVASGRSVRCWWFLISKLSKGVVPCGIRACKRLRVTPRIINFQGVMLSKRDGSIALFNTKHETHWWTAEELNVSQKVGLTDTCPHFGSRYVQIWKCCKSCVTGASCFSQWTHTA